MSGEPIKIELKGKLAALINAGVFPNTLVVGGKVVAEVRNRQSPPPRPSIPLKIEV